jgi:hypothetical protein
VADPKTKRFLLKTKCRSKFIVVAIAHLEVNKDDRPLRIDSRRMAVTEPVSVSHRLSDTGGYEMTATKRPFAPCGKLTPMFRISSRRLCRLINEECKEAL